MAARTAALVQSGQSVSASITGIAREPNRWPTDSNQKIYGTNKILS
jgi:hypothetical protein